MESGSGFGGYSGHSEQAGFPPVLVRNHIAGAPPLGSGLRNLVCPLIGLDTLLCWDPADGDLIVSRKQPGDGRGEGRPLL